jgi:tetratricopeptide (TPR) repeat protein
MKELRPHLVMLTFIAVVAALVWLATAQPGAPAPPIAPSRAVVEADPQAHARDKRGAEIRARFEQAVVMLHAREYDHAAAALHRVLELAPMMPEAHVNMGFAMLGLAQARAARDFFTGAIELRSTQANAYYGLALAHEADGDLPAAMGAMRAYLHLSPADDKHRAKARSALWEWETARTTDRASRKGVPR